MWRVRAENNRDQARGRWRNGLGPTPATELDWARETGTCPTGEGGGRRDSHAGETRWTRSQNPDPRHGNDCRREMSATACVTTLGRTDTRKRMRGGVLGSGDGVNREMVIENESAPDSQAGPLRSIVIQVVAGGRDQSDEAGASEQDRSSRPS